MNTRSIRIAGALILVYLIWGSTYLALKYAVAGNPPYLLVGIRNLLAGLILLSFMGKKVLSVRWCHLRAAAITGTMLIFLGNGSVTYAQANGVPSAVAALVVGLVPSWMLVFVLMIGKAKSTTTALLFKFAGFISGLIGLAVLVVDGSLSTGDGSGMMTAILIVGTIGWAYGSVKVKYLQSHPNLLTATALTMLMGGVVATAFSAGIGEFQSLPELSTEPKTWLAFSYLVIFGSVVAFSAYNWLLQNADPALAGTYAYVNPLVAMALGYFVAGESLGASVFIAGAMILFSVGLISYSTYLDRKARNRLPLSPMVGNPLLSHCKIEQ